MKTLKQAMSFILAFLLPVLAAKAQQDGTISAALVPETTTIYVNQSINVDVTVTSSGAALSKDMNLSNMPDSSMLRVDKYDELAPEQKVVNGTETETRRFRLKVTALKPGTLNVSPVLQVNLIKRMNRFLTTSSGRQIALAPVTLSIRNVPEAGRPADFSGCIGNVAFDAACTPLDPAPGDLITVSYTISGTANLADITTPAYTTAPGFKVYDLRKIPQPAADTVRCEQILAPSTTNSAVIPPLSFSFFEPKSGQYRTVTKGPFSLKFKSAAATAFEKYTPTPPAKDTPGQGGIASAFNSGYADVKSVSRETWLQAGASAFLLCTGVIIIGVIARTVRSRNALTKTGKALRIVTALAVLAGAVWGYYSVYSHARTSRLAQHTTRLDNEARIAPAMSAPATFRIPKGSKIQVTERYGNWIKIDTGRSAGWVSADTI